MRYNSKKHFVRETRHHRIHKYAKALSQAISVDLAYRYTLSKGRPFALLQLVPNFVAFGFILRNFFQCVNIHFVGKIAYRWIFIQFRRVDLLDMITATLKLAISLLWIASCTLPGKQKVLNFWNSYINEKNSEFKDFFCLLHGEKEVTRITALFGIQCLTVFHSVYWNLLMGPF